MQSKGIYSMVTTLFVVVAIIFIIFGLFFLNASVAGQEGIVFEETAVYERANDVKESILKCYGGLDLDKVNNIELAENCTARFREGEDAWVKGFSIEVLDFLACVPGATEIGDMNKCSQRFVYYAKVDENYMSCLGKLAICS